MEKEYERIEAQSLLDSMYNGSLQRFLSALYGGDKIDEREVEEIKMRFEAER